MRLLRHVHHNCKCACLVCCLEFDPDCEEVQFPECSAHALVYKGITDLWEACLCPKEEGAIWHAKACVMGECSICGVEKFLPLCIAEKDGNTLVQWKCFDKQVIGTSEETGEVRKRIREVFMETTIAEFVAYLKPNFQKFIRHNFVANWQDKQARLALEFLPARTIISHVDFAENHSFQVQNEIQSAYYHSYQVTIMVHITYHRNPDFVEGSDASPILKEGHFWISDDKDHDTVFVQFCFKQHWNWLQERGITPGEHWVFLDGCSAQFKSRGPFFFVARYPGITNGYQMKWHFFGTCHGKDNILLLTYSFLFNLIFKV
jgi:hypothetical protein